MQSTVFRALAVAIGLAVLAVAAALPLLLWGNDKAPEFYGAVVAAIIAAIAVVLGAFYQAELTRKRDDEIQRKTEISEATELFYWLDHAVQELDFIAQILNRFRDRVIAGESKIEVPIEQLRKALSANFMDELLQRVKIASRLPSAIAGSVTSALFGTFTAADRIYKLRGVVSDFSLELNHIDQYLYVSNTRITKLQEARKVLGEHLATRQAGK